MLMKAEFASLNRQVISPLSQQRHSAVQVKGFTATITKITTVLLLARLIGSNAIMICCGQNLD